MGLVKSLIEDLTYTILSGCDLEDTDENYSRVFRWVMEQNFAKLTEEELINLYEKEMSDVLKESRWISSS